MIATREEGPLGRARAARVSGGTGRRKRGAADEAALVAATALAAGDFGCRSVSDSETPLVRLLGEVAAHCHATLAEVGRLRAAVVATGSPGELAPAAALPGGFAALLTVVHELVAGLAQTSQDQTWMKAQLRQLTSRLAEQSSLAGLAGVALSELAPMVSAQRAVFHAAGERAGERGLYQVAGYAQRPDDGAFIRLGEGLVGQCACEGRRIVVNELPAEYMVIRSGLGTASPRALVVVPVLAGRELLAVLELGSFTPFGAAQLELLDNATAILAGELGRIAAERRTAELLDQSELLRRELSGRTEELERTNRELEDKAAALAAASRYKSELLANVSHELRTPLNSLLILSDHLARNLEGNLTPRQLEFARTVHSSGNDLLALLNDLLDLSKIEAGVIVLDPAEVVLADLAIYVERSFRPLAEQKGLELIVTLEPDVPETLVTDAKRLQQIVRNLLANAFKFTHQGEVRFGVQRRGADALALSVEDTGIGIAEEQQERIFAAFHQVEDGGRPKYGGSGLGLAISTELAAVLGGEISVSSVPGSGSTFTLVLPLEAPLRRAPAGTPRRAPPVVPLEPAAATRRALLVSPEASPPAAATRAAQLVGLEVTACDPATALALARELQPTCVVLAGVGDAGALVRRFKRGPRTEHLPIVVTLGQGVAWAHLRQLGAVGTLDAEADAATLRGCLDRALDAAARRRRTVLLAQPGERGVELQQLLAGSDLEVILVPSQAAARQAVNSHGGELLITAPELEDGSGVGLLEELCTTERPGVMFLPDSLGGDETRALEELAARLPVKLTCSRAELLRDSVVWLHRKVAAMSKEQQHLLRELALAEAAIAGRRVFLIDADVRNIFAMGSVLERHHVTVVSAECAEQALAACAEESPFDIVVLDTAATLRGDELVRGLRHSRAAAGVPILALSGRATAADRQAWLELGVADFIAKPLDADELLGIIALWLSP